MGGWKYGTGAMHYNAFPLIKAICISLTFYEPKLICCYLREYVLFLWALLSYLFHLCISLRNIKDLYFSIKYFMGISICCLCLCRNASCVSALFPLHFQYSVQYLYLLFIGNYIHNSYFCFFVFGIPIFIFFFVTANFEQKNH